MTYPNTGAAHMAKFSYYFADGKLASSIDQNGQTTSYHYNDSLDRLTEIDYPDGGKTTFSYNDAPYVANVSPSVTTSKLLSGSTYATSAVLTDGVNTYTWDAEGRMRMVTSTLYGGGTYTYDGDGRRVEKSTGKLYWYGADGSVISESDLAGNITDDYIFFDGKRTARVDSSGNVDYYLADELGSSRAVMNADGSAILDDCDFLPFGYEQCVASSSGNTYKFTGMERDTESGGLDHTQFRQYSSNLGRWLSPDPAARRLFISKTLKPGICTPTSATTLQTSPTRAGRTGSTGCSDSGGNSISRERLRCRPRQRGLAAKRPNRILRSLKTVAARS